jgi:hypothetical protein
MTSKARGGSRPAARAPPSPADKRNRQKAKATNRADAAGVVDDCAQEIQALEDARNNSEATLLRLATEKSKADPAPAGLAQKNKTREPEETRDPSGCTETLAQKKALEDAQLRAAKLTRDNELLAHRLKKLEAQSGPGASRARRKNQG